MLTYEQYNYLIYQFMKIDDAYLDKDKKILEEIYRKNIYKLSQDNKYLALAAKSHFSVLHLEEVTRIENKLKEAQSWGYFELYLLLNTIEQLSIDSSLNIIKKLFLKKYTYIIDCREYCEIFNRSIFMIVYLLIENNRKEEAEEILHLMNLLPIELNVSMGLGRLFLRGIFLYKFENQNKGQKIIDKVIYILKMLDTKKLVDYLRHLYIQVKEGKKYFYINSPTLL